jgi:hypothetical protein
MTSNERDTGPDSPDSAEWVDPWSWRAYPDAPAEQDPSAAEVAPAEDQPDARDVAADDEPADAEPAGDEPGETEPAAGVWPGEDDATVEMPPVAAPDESVEAEDAEDTTDPESAEAIRLPDLTEPQDQTGPDELVDSAPETATSEAPVEFREGEASDPGEDEAGVEPDPSDEPETTEDDAMEDLADREDLAGEPSVEEVPAEDEGDEEELAEQGESLDPEEWAERVRLLEDVEETRRIPSAKDDLWEPDDLAGLAVPDPDDDLAGEGDQDAEDDDGDAAEVAAAGPVAPLDLEVEGATQPLPPVPVARRSRPVGPPPPPIVLVPPPLPASPPERAAEPEPPEPPEPTGPPEPRARRPAIRIVTTTPKPAAPEPSVPRGPEPAAQPAGPATPAPAEPEPPAARTGPPAPVPTPWLRPVDPVTPGWLPVPSRPPEPEGPRARPPATPFPPVRLPEPPRERGPRQLQPARGGTGAPTLPPPQWRDRPSHWTRPGEPGELDAPWGLPPTPAPRPSSARRTWVIVVAVLAALAVASYQFVALVRSGREEPATTRRAPTAQPGQAGTSASPLSPEQQVTRLLAARSAAVLHHDKAAFLATVDRQRKSFYHAQGVLFDRMATVPFSAFSYSVPNPLQDLGTESSRQRYSPAMVFSFPVEASYRFKGQDTNPLLARFYYTFEVTHAGWRIAGQDDVRAPLRSDVEIWDAGAVRTFSTTRTLVVFHPGDAILARRLRAVAERGYGQVAASWSASWDKRVVVLLPADQKEAQRLVRTRDLSDVAAVTSSAIEAGPAHRLLGNRIIVNTSLIAGYRTLDLQVVMTHEMTHVATRNVGVGVPLYLVEGFADYTALRPLAAPLRLTRPSLASAVRGKRFKGKLPSRGQLVGADAALAYDEGSSFCLWVASAFGEGKLQALYRSFGDLDGDPTLHDEDVRFRRVLGISRGAAESRWAAFVKGAV